MKRNPWVRKLRIVAAQHYNVAPQFVNLLWPKVFLASSAALQTIHMALEGVEQVRFGAGALDDVVPPALPIEQK